MRKFARGEITVTNITLLTAFQKVLIPAGLLFTFATIGVSITASKRADSWSKRCRYLLMGGGLNFLSGISMSAYMLIDNPDFRVLPMLLFLSLIWGLIGATVVFNSVWAPEWWRRHIDRRINDEKGEDNEYV